MTEQFNPSEHTAAEVTEYLEGADDAERQRVAAAEQADKGRKTVAEAAGVDPDERTDASGRVLNPWEVSPEDQVQSGAEAEAAASESEK